MAVTRSLVSIPLFCPGAGGQYPPYGISKVSAIPIPDIIVRFGGLSSNVSVVFLKAATALSIWGSGILGRREFVDRQFLFGEKSFDFFDAGFDGNERAAHKQTRTEHTLRQKNVILQEVYWAKQRLISH